jgi:hypothetical protein
MRYWHFWLLKKMGQNLFNSLVTLMPPEDLEITGSSLIGLLFIPSSKSDNSTSTDKKVFNHSLHQKQKQNNKKSFESIKQMTNKK